ncbi:alkaline phosphatase-like isoform X2 [Eriocheir sinensis]|nr:alkaline phosphatase-like isoform X2 [Eriocheir sinensis]
MARLRTMAAAPSLPLLLLLLLSFTCAPGNGLEGRQHWWNSARNELLEALHVRDNWNVAKNMILFLGDGMGVTANTAARIFKGQKRGRLGEEGYMAWERFPNAALLKTYNVDKQVPDSAGTATAFLCGIKTNYYVIGLDSSVPLGDCKASRNPTARTPSILQWAQEAGKDTGIVTSTRITHATPAATYAAVAHRNWECDSAVVGQDCTDIAHQLVHDEPGRNIKVLLGGGRQTMGVPSDTVDATTCTRNDSRDLTQEWLTQKKSEGYKARYVTTGRELSHVDPDKIDFLMGLFHESHMPYEIDRVPGPSAPPTLKDMTLKALRLLQKSDEGFFLLVEGGRIDHALHDNLPHRAFEETVAMEDAVTAALKEVDLDETLVVVTADHSHVMTMNGYPDRGNDILGWVLENTTTDGLPYTTLMFTNGPGFNYSAVDGKVVRHDPSTVDTRHPDYRFQAAVPTLPIKETHGGEDVALWATGPMSHLFHRTHEQHYVAHAMAYAACIGPSEEDCKLDSRSAGGRNLRYHPTEAPRRRASTRKPSRRTYKPPHGNRKAEAASPSISVVRPDSPKFPTLSPILQQLLSDGELKILTATGPETVNSFSNALDIQELLGRSVTSVHGT